MAVIPSTAPPPFLNSTVLRSVHTIDTKSEENYYDLSKRRTRALQEVDNAQFSWFHFKVALIAGIGFFTDAYDLFAIGIVSVMLGYVYSEGDKEGGLNLKPNLDMGLKIAAPVGTFFGPLIFGWCADVLGRKRMYGVELMIIIIGTFGQAVSSDGHAINIFAVLIAWRFLMGLGIGGDYPSSAVIASEFAPMRLRGRLMTAVFACQGLGQLCAAIIAVVLIAAFKGPLERGNLLDSDPVDVMWRILVGLGCVPGVIALFFRLTIPETPRFTMDIERNVNRAEQDIDHFIRTGAFIVDPDARIERVQAPKASWQDFKKYFSDLENLRVLFGCAYCWFALDVAFYGLGLNSPVLLDNLFPVDASGSPATTQIYQRLSNIARGNMILITAGLIPGFCFCFIFIDKWGRKRLQYAGFAVSAVLLIVLGFGYDKMGQSKGGRAAFFALYCILNFFLNCGPNTTTFIVPSEAFPTRYRSTAHGIAASSGKLGAILSQVAFAKLKDRGGPDKAIRHILQVYALFVFTGFAATWLIPETKDMTLEELSNEPQDDFVQGPPLSPAQRRRASQYDGNTP